jgi:hypothetical protein
MDCAADEEFAAQFSHWLIEAKFRPAFIENHFQKLESYSGELVE